MRRVAVYLTVLLLFIAAVAIAWVAANWPHYCHQLHWCDGQGLL